ncbi:glycosyltransferase family 4 protein [Thermocoleostomius sinensis]|jgi:glycosyltransferase involved in cell wall biosynthesis|uniref:Glycosyltransferase family 4 protein n=1 Tax=Thermocoleostomius sinensis A174 TaxID=2016057 RepID=A0A9E8ZC67_9CYAN|nr:glycosyltransferase family 4 protein [Thermocoleostomius sinensis]WAL59157.1 glycosyltransferase family 4 protein [Thermocoleostomius sinensis A174]
MKIAMTHVDLPNEAKGGVAFQAHYLANALVDRGHDVTMFTLSSGDTDCRYRIHQYHLPSCFRRFKAFMFAVYLAKTDFSRFDVVHTHGDNYLLWNCHPQIRTFHGSAQDEARSAVRWQRRLYQSVLAGLEPFSVRWADISVGVSQATQSKIPAISTIIPCGVDTTYFRPGRKSMQPSLLFVGTVEGRKRGQYLANVFTQEVRPRFPNAELWMVSDRAVVGEGIVNLGKVSLEALSHLYQQAWLFCLPSTYEGFGVPYIEAMAAGTPVVATTNPGAQEVLQDGEYGLIVDETKLGQQINRLFQDPDLREVYARKGLNRVQAFSWSSIVTQYEILYRQLSTDLIHHYRSEYV